MEYLVEQVKRPTRFVLRRLLRHDRNTAAITPARAVERPTSPKRKHNHPKVPHRMENRAKIILPLAASQNPFPHLDRIGRDCFDRIAGHPVYGSEGQMTRIGGERSCRPFVMPLRYLETCGSCRRQKVLVAPERRRRRRPSAQRRAPARPPLSRSVSDARLIRHFAIRNGGIRRREQVPNHKVPIDPDLVDLGEQPFEAVR